LVWRKSSYSGGGGGECVELAFPPSRVVFRDSKNPAGPHLAFPRVAVGALIEWMRLREADLRTTSFARRDDEDLMLTTAERVDQEAEVVSAATRMFVALMKNDAGVRALVTDVVPEAFTSGAVPSRGGRACKGIISSKAP
jgi:hypothetical protein